MLHMIVQEYRIEIHFFLHSSFCWLDVVIIGCWLNKVNTRVEKMNKILELAQKGPYRTPQTPPAGQISAEKGGWLVLGMESERYSRLASTRTATPAGSEA